MIKLTENKQFEFNFVLDINKVYPDYTQQKYNGQEIYYYYANLSDIINLYNNGYISVSSKLNEIIECYNYYDKRECGKRCAVAFVLNKELKGCIKDMGGGTFFLNADIDIDDVIFIDMYVYKNGDGYGHVLSDYIDLVQHFGAENVRNITKQQFHQLMDIDEVLKFIK